MGSTFDSMHKNLDSRVKALENRTTTSETVTAEPDAYIKSASVSGNTLTLTKKDGTTVVFAVTTNSDNEPTIDDSTSSESSVYSSSKIDSMIGDLETLLEEI